MARNRHKWPVRGVRVDPILWEAFKTVIARRRTTAQDFLMGKIIELLQQEGSLPPTWEGGQQKMVEDRLSDSSLESTEQTPAL